MSRSDTNKRLARLDTLSSMLKSDEFHTVGDLANELGISKRTLHRDIEILRDRGLPIQTDRGRGGGTKLHRSWGVGRLTISDQELIDLLISLSIAEKMNSQIFMAQLKSIRHKVMALLAPSQKLKIKQLKERILIGGWASPLVLSSFEQSTQEPISDLNRAFYLKRVLSINYIDGSQNITEREIEPHYLYLNYPVWYVLAWDHLRADVRTFRCDRIQRSNIAEADFHIRPFKDFAHLISKDVLITP